MLAFYLLLQGGNIIYDHHACAFELALNLRLERQWGGGRGGIFFLGEVGDRDVEGKMDGK